MSFSVSLSWPFILAVLATAAAWAWAMSRPYRAGGFIPDMSPIFYGGAALILTLFAWLAYFAARVAFGF